MVADPARYVLRDTAEYDGALAPGRYAVLVRSGMVIDSIDLFFGFHRLNSGASVFLPVESVRSDDFLDGMDVTEHVVFDGQRRIALKTFLPHFSDYFSSPSVLDGLLYYWGLDRRDGGYRILAYRYDGAARRINACYLLSVELGADNRGHFTPPHAMGGAVRFETYGFEAVVHPELNADTVGSCISA